MIEVKNVSKRFGNFAALSDVTFDVPSGEIVGLLGPNGAGKTTTMRIITGFLNPTSGQVLIDGKDITDAPVESRAKIGYMPESAPLYQDMIVYDYLRYVCAIHNLDDSTKVPQLCKECGLSEVMHKNIGELSRGNKQRVALAHALARDPEILILDEPTSGLDPNQVEDVRALIKEIGKTRTVIVSTHILSEVETLCSRVIIISGGRVVADSPTDTLRAKYAANRVITLKAGGTEVQLSSCLNTITDIASMSFTKGEEGQCAVTISVKSDKDIRPIVAKKVIDAGLDLFEISAQHNSLEDVFHILTMGEGGTAKGNKEVQHD